VGRPAASDVSALSSFVANGRQTMHYVSSPPSKIPYGGFSPVRLQIGRLDATFAPAHKDGCLYAPIVRLARLCPWVLPLCGGGRGVGERPIQRPLARQRVMLSRRVLAYYGLIRGSGPLPAVSLVSAGSLPVGRGPERPQFTPLVPLSVPSSLPGGSGGV